MYLNFQQIKENCANKQNKIYCKVSSMQNKDSVMFRIVQKLTNF